MWFVIVVWIGSAAVVRTNSEQLPTMTISANGVVEPRAVRENSGFNVVSGSALVDDTHNQHKGSLVEMTEVTPQEAFNTFLQEESSVGIIFGVPAYHKKLRFASPISLATALSSEPKPKVDGEEDSGALEGSPEEVKKRLVVLCREFIETGCDLMQESIFSCLEKNEGKLTGKCKEGFLIAKSAGPLAPLMNVLKPIGGFIGKVGDGLGHVGAGIGAGLGHVGDELNKARHGVIDVLHIRPVTDAMGNAMDAVGEVIGNGWHALATGTDEFFSNLVGNKKDIVPIDEAALAGGQVAIDMSEPVQPDIVATAAAWTALTLRYTRDTELQNDPHKDDALPREDLEKFLALLFFGCDLSCKANCCGEDGEVPDCQRSRSEGIFPNRGARRGPAIDESVELLCGCRLLCGDDDEEYSGVTRIKFLKSTEADAAISPFICMIETEDKREHQAVKMYGGPEGPLSFLKTLEDQGWLPARIASGTGFEIFDKSIYIRNDEDFDALGV